MKANAPEIIWIDLATDLPKLSGHIDKKCVEYCRTDAFVEKVCDWLYDNLQTVSEVETPSAHHVESIPVLGIITLTEFTEKFKKEIRFLLD